MRAFSKISFSSIALCALLTLSACTSVTDSQRIAAPKSSAAAVKVNGVLITSAEVARAEKALLAQYKTPQKLPPEALKQARDAAVNQLIAAELLYQAASKLQIKDLDKQVAAKISQSKYQYPSQADFDKALKSMNMTQKELEDAARKDIVINNFIASQFAPQATVSESEVKKFYEDNKNKSFAHAESIQVSHILIAVPEKATPEAKKQAKEKAAGLLVKLKAGADFAAVAKAESNSPTKEQGGDLGMVSRGQSVPAFEKAAFALQAGQLSEVVETQFGYHIIKVVKKVAASTDKYQDVKGKIVVHLKREKIRKSVTEFLEPMRAQAKIEKV